MPDIATPIQNLKVTEASGLRGIVFNQAQADAHVMKAANAQSITSSRGLQEGITQYKIVPPPPGPLGFNTEGFVKALNDALATQTAGYAMELRQHGAAIASSTGGGAHLPVDGSEAWSSSVRMHIASCSKLVTGIAMTRTLAAHTVSPDTSISAYLPTYWKQGANISKITFRHLMTHTSGFHVETSESDYLFMKSQVEGGVDLAFLGQYHYENMNFGLCRILLSVMNGNIDAGHQFPAASQDSDWDYTTIQAYTAYVTQNVFTPAKVQGPTLDHQTPYALAYTFPPAAGWNSGDLTPWTGGAAWHMSVGELLDVMGTFRRSNTIMTSAAAQAMLDNGFGIDVKQSTPLGDYYNKNGLWANGTLTEQTLAYFLPKDMELVVFANSPVSAAGSFFRDVVTQIYLANIGPEYPVGMWRARHNMSGVTYQQAFNDYVGNHGMQLLDVSGYGAGGDTYAALWMKTANAPAWQARHGMTAQQYQDFFNEMNSQGYSPVVVKGYDAGGGQVHFAAIFQQGKAGAWQARHGLNAAQYQATFNQMQAQGLTLDWVNGYSVNGQDFYTAVWRQITGAPAWQARNGLTAQQYQDFFNQMTQQHYRLVIVSGYNVGGQAHYACLFRLIPNPPAWEAHHGMTSAQYQQTFDQLVGQGYRLEQVTGYTVGGQDLFAAIWTK